MFHSTPDLLADPARASARPQTLALAGNADFSDRARETEEAPRLLPQQEDSRFADMRCPRILWIIPAIFGEAGKLKSLHDRIAQRFLPGDRLVYLGNFLGGTEKTSQPAAVVDEVLRFRRLLLARPAMKTDDFVYLRGAQEEIWQKMLQVQFAPGPASVLEWMFKNGAESTLNAYGGTAQEALACAREGVMGLTRWTNRLRENIRRKPGHEKFGTVLKRAAFTRPQTGATAGGLLFVHSGIDAGKPLDAQGDAFWWGGSAFGAITAPYAHFDAVVRGYDPAHGGISLNGATLTLDSGCGFGGTLSCTRLAPDGEVLEILEA